MWTLEAVCRLLVARAVVSTGPGAIPRPVSVLGPFKRQGLQEVLRSPKAPWVLGSGPQELISTAPGGHLGLLRKRLRSPAVL
jgi:hypothetical protein